MTTSISGPAPDFDSVAEHVDNPHPAFPMRPTLKSSASTFADSKYSPHNDDLLTPPLTNPSLDDFPFCPAESDRTSLSMKRPHSTLYRRRRYNRACVSSGDVDQPAIFNSIPLSERRRLCHSQSAPNLTKLLPGGAKRNNTREKCNLFLAKKVKDEADVASRPSSLLKQPRRWTIAGKAAPTLVLTSTSSATYANSAQPVVHEDGVCPKIVPAVDTPAMITLQRAASGQSRRSSLRPEAYVSFPTPTFNETRSGFVTSLFGDGWQRTDNTLIHAKIKSISMTSHSRSLPSSCNRASVGCGKVRPCRVTEAEPVCTDMILDPMVIGQFNDSGSLFRSRRCSTKYVSGASMHEIIWDENISTSSSGTSRRTSSEQSRRISMRDLENAPERRQSMAMAKLETQLFNATGIQQSRKASIMSGVTDMSKPVSTTRRNTNGSSFHNTFNPRPTGFNADEQPEVVPPSRASISINKQKLTGPVLDLHLTTITGEETLNTHVAYCPPATTSTGLDASTDSLLMNPWRASWEARDVPNGHNGKKAAESEPVVVQQRRGSMLGQIAGVRKKSAQRKQKLVRGDVIKRKTRSRRLEEDEQPLLSIFNEWSVQ